MSSDEKEEVTIFVCGSNCQHEFGTEMVPIDGLDGAASGWTTVCKKCGVTAFSVAQWGD